MTSIGVTSTSFQVEKRDWLLGPSGVGPGENPTATLDVSAFTAGTYYPDGYIPSGTAVSKLVSGLWGVFDSGAASGEHGLTLSAVKVPDPADTAKDVATGLVVANAFVDHNKLPAGGKPVIATIRTAMPLIHFTTVTP